MIFMIGIVTSGRILVGYVYASEFLTKKWRIVFGTMNVLIDGSSQMWGALYFSSIDKHAVYFECIGVVLIIISLMGHLFFIPESPIWLLKKGRNEEAKRSIRKVMGINSIECEADLFELDNIN